MPLPEKPADWSDPFYKRMLTEALTEAQRRGILKSIGPGALSRNQDILDALLSLSDQDLMEVTTIAERMIVEDKARETALRGPVSGPASMTVTPETARTLMKAAGATDGKPPTPIEPPLVMTKPSRVTPKQEPKTMVSDLEPGPIYPSLEQGLAMLGLDVLMDVFAGGMQAQLAESSSLGAHIEAAKLVGEPYPFVAKSSVSVTREDSLTGKSKRLWASSWVLLLGEWDKELDQFLMMLPNGHELEYVALADDSPMPATLLRAISNSLMAAEDVSQMKKGDVGFTPIVARFWESQIGYDHELAGGDFNGMMLRFLASSLSADNTQGMERVR